MRYRNAKESQQQAVVSDDEKLRKLLRCVTVPCVPPGLDARMAESYLWAMSQLEAKSKEANIDLRKKVTLSLIRVFGASVALAALVILLIGFGLLNLPAEVIHILLASTIAQAVVLYKSVITKIFREERNPPGTVAD
jgi:hypothetical protein